MSRNRPVWVWVISLFFFLSAGIRLLTFFLILGSLLVMGGFMSQAQSDYFTNTGWIDFTLYIGIEIANLFGAIMLLLLKRSAHYLFLGSLTLNVLTGIWYVLSRGGLEAVEGPGIIGTVISLGILIMTCLYTKKLIKRRVLS